MDDGIKVSCWYALAFSFQLLLFVLPESFYSQQSTEHFPSSVVELCRLRHVWSFPMFCLENAGFLHGVLPQTSCLYNFLCMADLLLKILHGSINSFKILVVSLRVFILIGDSVLSLWSNLGWAPISKETSHSPRLFLFTHNLSNCELMNTWTLWDYFEWCLLWA